MIICDVCRSRNKVESNKVEKYIIGIFRYVSPTEAEALTGGNIPVKPIGTARPHIKDLCAKCSKRVADEIYSILHPPATKKETSES